MTTAEQTPPVDHRFPPSRRVLTRQEFDEIFKKGRKFVRPFFVVYTHFCEVPPAFGRIGVVVSRKVGNAVVRNRMKRLLREAFRRGPALRCEVVVVVRPVAAHRKNPELTAQFNAILAELQRDGAPAPDPLPTITSPPA